MQPSEFYKQLPTLTTPRLLLRRLCKEDAPAYFAFAGDPQVTQYLRWGPHAALQQTEDYLSEVADAYAAGTDGPWGIVLAQGGDLIGTIHLMLLEFDPGHWSAEVGVVIHRAFWRQGFAREALQRVLGFCFQDLGLRRVQALPIAENLPACRLLEACGMQKEGTLREYAYQKERYWDMDVYSVLDREYK